jgi:hypothetical protein
MRRTHRHRGDRGQTSGADMGEGHGPRFVPIVNRRLRQWGRYVPRETGQCTVTPGQSAPSLMEPPPDTTWVTFEPINQTGKPRKGRHRRQRT